MPTRRLSARVNDSRSLQRRLAKLESEAGVNAEPLGPIAVVFVKPNGHFGGEECESDRASDIGGGHEWRLKEDESQEDFRRRVMADAPKATGLNGTGIVFWPADCGGGCASSASS
jgi:hypothetical protein